MSYFNREESSVSLVIFEHLSPYNQVNNPIYWLLIVFTCSVFSQKQLSFQQNWCILFAILLMWQVSSDKLTLPWKDYQFGQKSLSQFGITELFHFQAGWFS